jgi:hypothetical protein
VAKGIAKHARVQSSLQRLIEGGRAVAPSMQSLSSLAPVWGVGAPVDPAGFPIDTSRPKLANPDGSFSTERTITVGFDDGFYNIPTIWDGAELDEEAAIKRARQALRRGQQFPRFRSVDEAVAAARARSAEIGRIRGPQ